MSAWRRNAFEPASRVRSCRVIRRMSEHRTSRVYNESELLMELRKLVDDEWRPRRPPLFVARVTAAGAAWMVSPCLQGDDYIEAESKSGARRCKVELCRELVARVRRRGALESLASSEL